MKNLVILLVLLSTLVACKNKVESQEPVSDSVSGEIATDWTGEQDEAFLKNCNGFLDNEGVEEGKAYCDCLLEATKKAHPDPQSAMDLEQNDIVSLFEESGCLDDYLMVKIEDPWTEEVSMAFLEQCKKSKIEAGEDSSEAESYCSCALEKIKELIPQPQHLVQLTSEEWESIIESCK